MPNLPCSRVSSPEFIGGNADILLETLRGRAELLMAKSPQMDVPLRKAWAYVASVVADYSSWPDWLALRGLNNVDQEHSPRHRPHTSGVGRNPTGYTLCFRSNIPLESGLAR